MGQHGRRSDREVGIGLEKVSDITIAKQFFNELSKKNTPEKLQLFFESNVLDRYQEQDGIKIIRTDTSGRISKTGVWSFDFGISGEDDAFIHLTAESFFVRLPERERDHWIEHMVTLPVSKNFLKGLVRPGCLDDGPIRNW
ncbi:MAG TPA: hypothetical protein VFK44_04295 [Bacillales bacterium]|nr:hypothetical protein [Bacillales bacterium]